MDEIERLEREYVGRRVRHVRTGESGTVRSVGMPANVLSRGDLSETAGPVLVVLWDPPDAETETLPVGVAPGDVERIAQRVAGPRGMGRAPRGDGRSFKGGMGSSRGGRS